MTKTKFAIIHNLDSLTDAQIEAYLRAVSVHFEVDPDLNAFDVLWMESADGPRKRVAYARKGTTDILRDKRGISVSTLTQHDGPGYVSFTATGKNTEGRQEIAVGAHSIEGLKGTRLADAVMTAQTRALRRLTLQFVGGGILDVSEVGTTTDINASKSSLATLAGSPAVMPPMMAPVAAAPSRDITVVSTTEPAATTQVLGNEPVKPVEVVNVSEKVVNAAPDANALEQTALAGPEPAKKRTRKKRNTVSLDSPGQAPVSPSADISKSQQAATPTPPVAPVAPVAPPQPPPPAPAPPPSAPVLPVAAPVSAPTISAEKKKEFTQRLGKYSQDILPKAGMVPSEGIGGVTMKLRKFAEVFSGQTGNLTEEQTETLLNKMDAFVEKYGAPELVKYINKTLGVEN